MGAAQAHVDELRRVRRRADLSRLAPRASLDARHARAWYNLGLARNSQGKTAEALEALSRAEALEPDDPRIPYARATILARAGRDDEARLAARRALELQPNYPDARGMLQTLER